jgi:glycosyltransferase involved in cell wall biosynthesis
MPSLVSIVLPLYNGAAFITETLASLAAQTLQAAELIVVNDGSTDDSPRLVEEFCRAASSPVLRSLRMITQANQGVAAARNTGIAAARADWIALIDQDDLWLPHKLEQQWQAICAAPQAVWHYAAFTRFYASGREVHKINGSADRGETLRRLVAGELFIPPAAALVRTDICRVIGGFDSTIIPSDDWDFFLKLAAQYELAYTPHCLVRFRSHPTSTGKRQRRRIFEMQEHVLQRHLPQLAGVVPARLINRRFANIYWHLGREAAADGDRAAARTLFRCALRLHPTRIKLWRSLLASLV